MALRARAVDNSAVIMEVSGSAESAAHCGLLFTIPSLLCPLSDVTTILVCGDARAHRYTCPASPDGQEARLCVAVVDNTAVNTAHTETLLGPCVSSVVLSLTV